MVQRYHVQLPFLLRDTGDAHRRQDRGGQRQVGVDCRAVLPVPVIRDGRVETGPEHPQEQCT